MALRAPEEKRGQSGTSGSGKKRGNLYHAGQRRQQEAGRKTISLSPTKTVLSENRLSRLNTVGRPTA